MNDLPHVTATERPGAPPIWAILERALIDAINASVQPFLDKYVDDRGWLIWHDTLPVPTRDGADDFFEPFYNWPLAYLIGADARLLELSRHQFDAITDQCTALGYFVDGFERGYDAFHTGEGLLFFYHLCLADPANATLRRLAQQFADLYADPSHPIANYDGARRLIRAPHSGSEGPRWGYFDGDAVYEWRERMRPYGLPYEDIQDISHFDDLRDPVLARRMGEAMEYRMGRGDTAANLCLTSLVTNAYLMTGKPRYKNWVLDYVGAWEERTAANDGLVPDNVGLSGDVGEYVGGRWYGGAYGWEWPHGYYSVGMAVAIAASNTFLLTRDDDRLAMARALFAKMRALAQVRDVTAEPMSLAHHWEGMLPAQGEAMLIPYRIADSGWFDYQPPIPTYPIALALLGNSPADWREVDWHRAVAGFDWHLIRDLRAKEDAGHEPAWLCYLAGTLPDYPERMLQVALGQVARRVELIRADASDPLTNHIHHWQEVSPVTTEALLQLVMGAPSPLYNGGLINARLMWFDAAAKRPGLPCDVAALVERIDVDRTVVDVVNLSRSATRELIVQGGAFGEHRFVDANGTAIGGNRFVLSLPPETRIRLDLATQCHAYPARITTPWDEPDELA